MDRRDFQLPRRTLPQIAFPADWESANSNCPLNDCPGTDCPENAVCRRDEDLSRSTPSQTGFTVRPTYCNTGLLVPQILRCVIADATRISGAICGCENHRVHFAQTHETGCMVVQPLLPCVGDLVF